MSPSPEIIEVTMQQFEELMDRVNSNTLRDEDRELMQQIFASYHQFFRMVEDKKTTIARLRKLLFGSSSEKTQKVFGETDDNSEADDNDSATDVASSAELPSDSTSDEPEKSPPGHGRHGADDYSGADQVHCQHPN